MRLAVSTIAWPADRDDAVAESLLAASVTGVEVAPTKAFANPAEATPAEVDAVRQAWERRGLPVVAAQSLLFGQPELTLFESAEVRRRTLAYLESVVRVCAGLGAKALVFGSPRNRRAGGRDRAAVWAEAVDFFGRLADVAASEGTCVVLEANPPEYGADFVTTAAEAVELVRVVDHVGLRLHLDAACLALAGESFADAVAAGARLLAHAHASEPNLAPLGTGGIDHAAFAGELRRAGYSGWVSVEMREPTPFDANVLATAVRAAGVYL